MKINESLDIVLDSIDTFLYVRSKFQSHFAIILFVPYPMEQIYFNAREIEVIRVLKETLESLRIKEPVEEQFVKSLVPGLLFLPLKKDNQEEIMIKRQIDSICEIIVINLGNPSLSDNFKEILMDAKTQILLRYGNHEKLRDGLLS